MGTVSPSQSSAGQEITAAKINDPVNQLAAVINGGIDADNLEDSGVTTAKIANDAVTATKIDWASTGADGGIWWEELGRTTLGSAGDTISVASFGARKYLKILISLLDTGGTLATQLTFNADTGSNYAFVTTSGESTAATATSQSNLRPDPATAALPVFIELDVINIATSEKLVNSLATGRGTAGGGNAPTRRWMGGKWANTSDQISTVTVTNGGTGDFAIGSEVVVLGHN